MGIRSSDLSWIVVSDLKRARKFFVETLGLKEISANEEWGWVEVQGKEGGATIGIGIADKQTPVSPGGNAVVTLTVDNLEETKKQLQKKEVSMVGDIMEVPGHVKMQLLKDEDGNLFQLVEVLGK